MRSDVGGRWTRLPHAGLAGECALCAFLVRKSCFINNKFGISTYAVACGRVAAYGRSHERSLTTPLLALATGTRGKCAPSQARFKVVPTGSLCQQLAHSGLPVHPGHLRAVKPTTPGPCSRTDRTAARVSHRGALKLARSPRPLQPCRTENPGPCSRTDRAAARASDRVSAVRHPCSPVP